MPLLRALIGFGACALLTAFTPRAEAQQLVYTPRSPSFGGNALNFSPLLTAAQAQNDFEEAGREVADPLDQFETNLQRQLLNQLSRELVSSQFEGVSFEEAGTFQFGDFSVEVVPGLDGLSVRVFNLLTGDESVITIPSLP